MEVPTTVALALLAAAAALTAVRLWRGPSLADRMIALDALLFQGASALGVLVVRTGDTALVPLLVVIVLIAFAGTVVVARALENGERE
ncbi:MAG: hypothetical protein JW785_04960 [Acidimicrobiia bacterium]|nr:hypothetical protein [Acidimicrobiia bacterium]